MSIIVYSILLLVDVSSIVFQCPLFVEDVAVDWIVDWIEFQHVSTVKFSFNLVSSAIFSLLYKVIFLQVVLGSRSVLGSLGSGLKSNVRTPELNLRKMV